MGLYYSYDSAKEAFEKIKKRDALKIFSPGQLSAIEIALDKRIKELEKRLKNAAEAGEPIEEIKLLLQDAEEALEIVK
ncbi:hypothetical protein [Paenibacillus terreus]|uniref:hypothetical protein n=1 Tax=Paenibacillus terreus TaxID=1387834 RepID=UPI0035CD010A